MIVFQAIDQFVRRNLSIDSLVVFVLFGAVIFQGYSLIEARVFPEISQINQLKGRSMKYRSAYRALGEVSADYIEFLNEVIPENSRVLIPPWFPQHPMAHVGAMQFYLFPREIHNCGSDEVEECILRMKDSDFYVIMVEGFPPRDLITQVRKFVPFRDNLGVYGPDQ